MIGAFREKDRQINFAIEELEKVDAEILELTNYLYIEPEVFDIIGKHIEELKGSD